MEEELVVDGGATDRKHYTILTEERIRQRQENDISQVSTLLSLSRGLACTLLRLKNWSLTSVFEDWFSDEESVRQLLGLLPEPEEPPKTDNNRCNICFEEVETENKISAHCGHPFCLDCWKTHLSVSIQNGPACFSLRCPEPECKANPGPDMVDRLASDEEKQKYYGHILWSYVDGHRNLKWCPGSGCDLAIELDAGERENLDITCDCSYSFCWNCMEENHRPVKCEIVAEWMKLITLESDDTPWILQFIKRCPKCRRRIEKYEGCTHMTCREPCGFQFCWLCLEPWSYGHACNSSNYETRESLGGTRELVRYAHFLGRWASNHRSRETALLILQRARGELLETLKDVQKVPISDLGFVIEALEQIAECRRVLKWSYAYGYHLYPKAVWFRSTALDDFCEVRARVRFFNHMQGEAENVLERIHHFVDTEMEKYLNADCPSDDFRDYRKKVIDLTRVARSYFEDFVKSIGE